MNINKKRVVAIFVVLFMIILSLVLFFTLGNDKKDDHSDSNTTSSQHSSVTQQTPTIDKTDWRLLLINYENALPDNYGADLAETYNSALVDKRIKKDLEKMIDDAKSNGFNLFIRSSYRSTAFQTKIFNNKVKMYMKQGHTKEEAEKLTLEYSSRPGHSEHEAGLCVDIVASDYRELDEGQHTRKEQKWLHENCYKYGFILRYPEGKTEITKIKYESWHYRYVGVEAAEYIMKNNLTLEEYLNN